MSWDFETEPEFQKQLDWIEKFVREEVEPLDYVLGSPYDVRDANRNKLVRPLQAEVRKRKLWACHLEPELGGQGYGQVKLALMNEILGRVAFRADRFRLPGAGYRQRRNPRPLRHAGAEEEVPRAAARQRDRLVLLDDRAAGRRRSESLRNPRRAEGRQLGDQRREVVLLQRAMVVVPDHDGGDRSRSAALQAPVDVHRADGRAGHQHRAQRRRRPRRREPARPRLHALPGRARAEGPSARRARRRLRRRADAPRRRAHPSCDAHDRRRCAAPST